MSESIENLVICSTLNQITNYLIIKKLKPKRVFNITLDKSIDTNLSIKNEDWDRYLRVEFEKEYSKHSICNMGDDYNISLSDKRQWIDIKFNNDNYLNFNKFKETIKKIIINNVNDEQVYWHLTGGQRIIMLAISDFVKSRDKDKILYVEGNSERLLVYDKKRLCGEEGTREKIDYGYDKLNIETALRLVGMKTNLNLKSCKDYKNCKEKDKKNFREEHQFYMDLYKFCSKNKDFRNKLIKINKLSKENIKVSKGENYKLTIKYRELVKLFNEFKTKSKYDFLNSEEVKKVEPVGYIFEKIMAHKIYDLVKENNNILQRFSSLKIYSFDDDINGIVDEIDIILLTNTGKIISFECKSGGMSGDNAKSTKYTTYRLAGVFGMPILLSPLYENECISIDSEDKKILENQYIAYRTAKKAELKIICIDEISSELKKLLV